MMYVNLNWGQKIGLFYGTFVVALLTMVIASTYQNFDLVRADYYEAEQEVDAMQLAQKAALELKESVDIRYEGQELQFFFPSQEGEIIAQVHLYRPSNADWDQETMLAGPAAAALKWGVGELAPGYWKVKLDWQAEGRRYAIEKTLILP
ncbi:MAG: FixH family protein [Bacteroidota bacterium]